MSSPHDDPHKLNLFKFVTKRKHSTSSGKSQDPIEAGQNQQALPTIDTNQDVQPFDSQYFSQTNDNGDQYEDSTALLRSPLQSPSESSLIFERSVEDPAQVYQQTTCPRCGSKSTTSQGGLKCNHQSIVNLPSHYSVENFVSPCLDATTQILTDETKNLDDVDMVYSRRPSTVLGLNLALGRTKSVAETGGFSTSPNSPQTQRTQSFASIRDLNQSRPPPLSFYSYADMINNENPNPRRPSISQSLSSSFINSRSNSLSNNNPSFAQNKGFNIGNSITPQRINSNTAGRSRTSISSAVQSPSVQQQRLSNVPRVTKNFSLNPDNSPNSSDSESDYGTPLQQHQSITSRTSGGQRSSFSKISSHNIFSPSSRRNTNTITPLNRTTSNQSSVISGVSSNRRFSQYNDPQSDSESLVVSSIGDQLRKNTGEIKSN